MHNAAIHESCQYVTERLQPQATYREKRIKETDRNDQKHAFVAFVMSHNQRSYTKPYRSDLVGLASMVEDHNML